MDKAFEIENLSFKYHNSSSNILEDVNLTVNKEDFILICGASGCGKTTLLKQLSPSLTPNGEKHGNISFFGQDLNKLDIRTAIKSIGYLSQHPDDQIVCSDPIQELAFGLQNIGLDSASIRLRIAEVVSFFGLHKIIDQNISSLSGGQKQLLNLASVMIMQPRVLLLDEPTAQLDPLSTDTFINAIKSANDELGTTIIITEHKTDKLLPIANRLLILDNSKITLDCYPKSNNFHVPQDTDAFLSMPSPLKIFTKVQGHDQSVLHPPLNTSDGRKWLTSLNLKCIGSDDKFLKEASEHTDYSIELKDIWFRYNKKSPDILKGLSLKIPKNQIFCLLGDNASGKSTLLSIICKVLSPYSGKILIDKSSKLSCLPQNPKSIFFKETVFLDLENTANHAEIKDLHDRIDYISELTEIVHLLNSHPYDLSGGELQRAALAKVLLLKPDILLLDEPTKGLDPKFKIKLLKILKKLKLSGLTIIIVSHDMDFCAYCADCCALIFNGKIVSSASPKLFFSQNNFYTTTASKISRGLSKHLITDEDVILSRKFKLIKTNKQLILQSLLIFIVVPLLILLAFTFFGDEYYYLTASLILVVPIISLFIGFERQSLNAQKFIILAVFTALTVVSRAALFMIPQFKPIIALVIISGIFLGANDAFLIGSMSAFISNFFFGQGPWTIFQMFALGFVGFVSGLLFYNRSLNFNKLKSIVYVMAYGLIATFVYSAINNFGFLIMTKATLSLQSFISASALSLPLDAILAAATLIFLLILIKPMDKLFSRLKTKFSIQD